MCERVPSCADRQQDCQQGVREQGVSSSAITQCFLLAFRYFGLFRELIDWKINNSVKERVVVQFGANGQFGRRRLVSSSLKFAIRSKLYVSFCSFL